MKPLSNAKSMEKGFKAVKTFEVMVSEKIMHP